MTHELYTELYEAAPIGGAPLVPPAPVVPPAPAVTNPWAAASLALPAGTIQQPALGQQNQDLDLNGPRTFT